MIRVLRPFLGGALLIAGTVWFLQGVNVLPGSFMSGRGEWAVYGVLAILAGAGLLFFSRKKTDS